MDKDTIKAALKEAILQRRSTRAYTDQPVEDELVEEIIEAGRYSPSANNKQAARFIVITNAEKRAELRAVVTGVLAAMPENEGMPPVFLSLLQRARQGEVDVTYGAPVLIVTANKKGSMNGAADCACALQNMMLTASALGLGNVWINQFYMLRDAPPVADFFKDLGLEEDEEVWGALSVGYSEKIETTPLPRTGNNVTYIK